MTVTLVEFFSVTMTRVPTSLLVICIHLHTFHFMHIVVASYPAECLYLVCLPKAFLFFFFFFLQYIFVVVICSLSLLLAFALDLCILQLFKHYFGSSGEHSKQIQFLKEKTYFKLYCDLYKCMPCSQLDRLKFYLSKKQRGILNIRKSTRSGHLKSC